MSVGGGVVIMVLRAVVSTEPSTGACYCFPI